MSHSLVYLRPRAHVRVCMPRIQLGLAAVAGTLIWAANGMGRIECLDLRMNKMQGSLKGPAGAVKGLALHPELPLMASVGLDRFLRVHNVESKALLCKLYLKQQLTAVAWSPELPNSAAVENEAAEEPSAVTDASLGNVSNMTHAARKHSSSSSSKRSSAHPKGKSKKKKQKVAR